MTEDYDHLILKAILKEMPEHRPWCYDEWGDEEAATVKGEFDRFIFDPHKLRNDIIKFSTKFIGNTAIPFDGKMSQAQANKMQDCRDFADVVIDRIKQYRMVDADLHGVLDI